MSPTYIYMFVCLFVCLRFLRITCKIPLNKFRAVKSMGKIQTSAGLHSMQLILFLLCSKYNPAHLHANPQNAL